MKKKPLTNKSGKVRELTGNDMKAMKPPSKVLPSDLLAILPKRKIGQRGPQKKPTKVPITLRYSPDVVQYFKNTGNGWQVRMDEALKEWIAKHRRAA